MDLKLSKPIVFFDLETTGINISKDRIVEISLLKIFPNGNKESKTWLVNPEIEIPVEVSVNHGITNEKVVTEPTFKELAETVNAMISDSDLAGFNSNRFDIPLLAEEFLRVGVDFDMDNKRAIDVQVIFHKKEQRTLSAGYKFYCGKILEDAHSAEADTNATYEILKAQLDRYDDIENSVEALSAYSTHSKRADFAGFILFNDKEEEIFSFGKYKGRIVEDVFKENPGYNAWIQNADFPLYTKKVLKSIKERMSIPKKGMSDAEKLNALQQKFFTIISMYVKFEYLPSNSRVWVYQSEREFSNQEINFISEKAIEFIDQWTKHGFNLKGSFTFKYNQFLILAVDEGFNNVSGCSIDSSVRFVKELEKSLEVDMMNKMNISFKDDDDDINIVRMSNFKEFTKSNKITSETIVFNNMISTIGELETQWEVSVNNSWHKRFLVS